MLQRGEIGKKNKKHVRTPPHPAKTLTMTAFINTVALLQKCYLEFHK